ncbi:PAQR family membrane homeostasis protein TrhA [Massilibacteroides vaginae]|uniref:PAQR family membrane homeostasis protein TrhA n=1 Tax=Massilibacteroides vaginae TaxID=1673718 RepID=UPI000A1CA597|nr:hemolysin III family protein [Massilibacteroides vaginae]
MTRARQYSPKEEAANALSHALGILLGIVSGYFLLKAAGDDLRATISVWVYLFGMLSCYILSTCYHASVAPKRKQFLQKLDHASIYLHIAGSYTPFTLITLRDEAWWGWGIFLFVWLSAIVGVILSFRKHTKHNHLETVCYVVMGCAILVALKPLLNALSAVGQTAAFYWLLGGGVSYIIGAVFYSFANMKYMHTVFHFFVLGGSVCHICAIYLVVS